MSQSDVLPPTRWLLLTATVAPPSDSANLRVRSPTERMEQYRSALLHYLQTDVAPGGTLFSHVVFAENSGTDLAALEAEVKRVSPGRVTFVSWTDDYMPPAFDRGYREMRLIDRACRECDPLREALASGVTVWKITGRYRILNCDRLIAGLPPGRNLYVDLRRWPRPWFEMRVFGFDLAGLERFLRPSIARLTNDKATEETLHHLLESELSSATAPDAPSLSVARSLAAEPRVDGVRGSDGVNYLSGKSYIKYLLRSGTRLLRRG